MKKLLEKLIVLSILAFVASLVLNQYIYPKLQLAPWSYGSELIELKRKELTQKPDKFNTIIIGSSRTFRQVDTYVLDSVTASGIQTRSYNFGANWLFPPESIYVYDKLVIDEGLTPRFVILELSKIPITDFKNLHTSRTIYWYTFSGYSFAINSIAGSCFSISLKVAALFAHTINYIDNLINLGYITNIFSFRSTVVTSNNNSSGFNGFLPLTTSAAADLADAAAGSRHRNFLADTASVIRRLEASIQQFQKYDDKPELLNKFNHFYANALLKKINDAKVQNIHLVFLIPPRVDRKQLDELIPLFHQLPQSHRIELCDGRAYPELYHVANSYDETHLNERGAGIYTELLANRLNRLTELN